MVKDHTDSERRNTLPPHGLLFPISSKGSFICIIPQTGQHIPQPLLHIVVEHWVEREIAQWVHHEGSIRLPRSYISLQDGRNSSILFNDKLNTFLMVISVLPPPGPFLDVIRRLLMRRLVKRAWYVSMT